nr:immunoglobulin light chain junction region [Homo sapiens]MCB77772.1 immunoglobulin light chain junction region [Homo sapiens]
AVYYCQQYGSS